MASTLECQLSTFRAKMRELTIVTYSERGDAGSRLNDILDSINSLDYSMKIIETYDGEEALMHCCRVVPVYGETLVAKFCQLVVNVTFKQQINLTNNTYNTVMYYLIHCMENCPSWLIVDMLRALGSLLYQNGDLSAQFNSILLWNGGLLMTFAASTNEDVKRLAIQCMENMCMKGVDGTKMDEEYARLCCDNFIQILYEEHLEGIHELGYARMAIAALRGLTHALNNHKNLLQDRIGEVLAIVKTFMLYNGEFIRPVPLFPTLVSQQESIIQLPKLTQAKISENAKRRKKKKKNLQKGTTKAEYDEESIRDLVEIGTLSDTVDGTTNQVPQPRWRLSSDSEYSDPEGDMASKLISYFAKTRMSALNCLSAVIKSSERRLLFGYWIHLLSDSSNRVQTQTLFTCTLKDRHPKCRLAALTALSCLLDGSKQFLVAADDKKQTKTAFMPYSMMLATMVKGIHVNLLRDLISEQVPSSITQVIKCLGVLVENTSYQNLKPGLLTCIVKQIRKFMSHGDTNIRVACLTCMGSVLSIQLPLVEVSHIVRGSDNLRCTAELGTTGELSTSPVTSSSESPLPSSCRYELEPVVSNTLAINWLVAACIRSINLKLIQPDSELRYEPLPVRLESLQVLSHLVRGYFADVRSDFNVLKEVAIYCLDDSASPIQLHGAKLLEAIGNVINSHTSSSISNRFTRITYEEGAEFWTMILTGPLQSLMQKCSVNVVQAMGCDSLSTIGAYIFALLPLQLRTFCITLLLGFTMDADHVTRSSAVRTLGVYVMYDCLRVDVNFVADLANTVLILLGDSSIIVRIKAAWSLGNVSDAMCVNKESNDEDFLVDFSDLLLLKMLQGALKSCEDNDKIRIHAVRALGNILRYMPPRPLEKSSLTHLVSQAIHTIVQSVGTGAMKVRWNACYALGNVLKNEALPTGTADWTPVIFSCLSIAVRDSKNFKVRINAASALGRLASRKQLQCHDEQIEMIWFSLNQSLQNMDVITDIADYKLRDRLPLQICSTLIHLIQFLEIRDLTAIRKSVSSNLLLLKEWMGKYYYSMCEELSREVGVRKALDHLKELQITCQDEYNSVTVQNLLTIFTISELEICHTERYNEKAGLSWLMTSSQSSFRDTYD